MITTPSASPLADQLVERGERGHAGSAPKHARAAPPPARPPPPAGPHASRPAPAGARCPSARRRPPRSSPSRSPVSCTPMSDVRAAVMHGPGRLTVERFPEPDPAPGAAVLRMLYSGICGTDKHTWRGESLQYAGTDHERPVPYPIICGHENVGVIEAIGDGPPPVDALGLPLAVGDRVVPAPNLTCGRCRFCLGEGYPYYLCTALDDYGNSLTCAEPPHLFGGWAERMYLLPGTRLFRVPDELPSRLAALTEVLAVTHGLDAARSMQALGGGFRLRRHGRRGRPRPARPDAPGQGRDAGRRPPGRGRPDGRAARARARLRRRAVPERRRHDPGRAGGRGARPDRRPRRRRRGRLLRQRPARSSSRWSWCVPAAP